MDVYPYVDYLGITSETCQLPKSKNAQAYLNYPKIVTSVNDHSSFEERRDVTMAAVAQQPIASTLTTGCDLFISYGGGVLTHDEGCQCCEASCIDHAVVIVGYNTTAKPPYWKVRNSWGPEWGEEGHFKVAMDDPGCGWGLFGILSESALMEDVYTSLDDLPERPSWWDTAQGWEKAFVIVASILGFCCLCGCLGAIVLRVRK